MTQHRTPLAVQKPEEGARLHVYASVVVERSPEIVREALVDALAKGAPASDVPYRILKLRDDEIVFEPALGLLDRLGRGIDQGRLGLEPIGPDTRVDLDFDLAGAFRLRAPVAMLLAISIGVGLPVLGGHPWWSMLIGLGAGIVLGAFVSWRGWLRARHAELARFEALLHNLRYLPF